MMFRIFRLQQLYNFLVIVFHKAGILAVWLTLADDFDLISAVPPTTEPVFSAE
jgi:hypothetical protein